MTDTARAGALIYAKDLASLSTFYQGVLPAARVEAGPQHHVLAWPDFQLTLHAIPPHIAETITLSVPPAPREETPLKLIFTVPSLAEAAQAAARLGGRLFDTGWEGPGFRARGGWDPEGNIFELRESEPADPIPALVDAYRAAVFARDVDALAALYDPEVRVFDTWGRWSYDGRPAWRAMLAEWLGSLGTERVRVEMDEVRAEVTPELAVAHAFVTYQGLSAEGQPLRAMTNRLTWIVRRREGAWRIVHEHTSAPIDFDGMKAILKR